MNEIPGFLTFVAMSRVEDDSDDDKVEYLDYDSGSTGKTVVKHGSDSRTPNRRDKPAVFQSLFQQKRYKGDVRTLERCDRDIHSIDVSYVCCWWWY
jgi:hypothetical protein